MRKKNQHKKEFVPSPKADALKILDRISGPDPDLQQMILHETTNAQVAREIYQIRIRGKLTQAQLAELVGTTQSVISRLEDADYEGHSLAMLQRIAAALQKRVEIRFVPIKSKLKAA